MNSYSYNRNYNNISPSPNNSANNSYVSHVTQMSQDFSFCSGKEKWRGYKQYIDEEKSNHSQLEIKNIEKSNNLNKQNKLDHFSIDKVKPLKVTKIIKDTVTISTNTSMNKSNFSKASANNENKKDKDN